MDNIRVFVSFDYAHDKAHANVLSALTCAANPGIGFVCLTSDEAEETRVPTAKSVRAIKIRQATHTLVLVGMNANKFHADNKEIGTRNWQWWEIEESDREAKGLVAVRLEPEAALPNVLFGKHPLWAKEITADAVLAAINKTCIPVAP